MLMVVAERKFDHIRFAIGKEERCERGRMGCRAWSST